MPVEELVKHRVGQTELGLGWGATTHEAGLGTGIWEQRTLRQEQCLSWASLVPGQLMLGASVFQL